jgi:drug/metabolite transporter (DMT)-like permease
MAVLDKAKAFLDGKPVWRATLVLLSAITVTSFAAYRLGLSPVGLWKPLFVGAGALGALAGFTAAQKRNSVAAAVACALATLFFWFWYTLGKSEFVGVEWWKTMLLLGCYFGLFGGLYAFLRVVVWNRGLKEI